MQAYPSVLKINGEHVMFTMEMILGNMEEMQKSDLINYYVFNFESIPIFKNTIKSVGSKYRIKRPINK